MTTDWTKLTSSQHRRRKVWAWISFENYWRTGDQKLLFVRMFATIGGITAGVRSEWWYMAAIGFAYVALCITIGALWDWRGYYLTEREWLTVRNPFAREVREKLVRGDANGDK